MAWCQIGDKPLSETMIRQLTDTYIEGILPKGPYPPCRALLAGYPRYVSLGSMSAGHREINNIKSMSHSRIFHQENVWIFVISIHFHQMTNVLKSSVFNWSPVACISYIGLRCDDKSQCTNRQATESFDIISKTNLLLRSMKFINWLTIDRHTHYG